MPDITINGQVISFPASGDSPDWSPAIVQFAQAVAAALAISTNAYDVSPQTFTIDSYNSASNVNIPNLTFPTNAVRTVFIRYSVYRTTNSANAYEAGDLVAIYNPNNATNSKWAVSQIRSAGGGANLTFNMTDAGQIQFTTTALSGSSHAGKIAFDARAFAQ
jgi:hypothetical protein